jgi:SAM-dependent methyltransferase
MVTCSTCVSIYLDPRPDAESLPRLYGSYYTHAAEPPEKWLSSGLVGILVRGYLSRRFGLGSPGACSVAGHLLFRVIRPFGMKLDFYCRHLLPAEFPAAGSLLDIGCGNGAFLLRARSMGWRVAGYEPDPEAVRVCRAAGLDVQQGDFSGAAVGAGTYDVITVSHVLEHVAEPLEFLRQCRRLLRDGGSLWIAAPNPQSLDRVIFGAGWRGLHMPFHLCIPSRGVLLSLLREAGFSNVRLRARGAQSRAQWFESMDIYRRERVGKIPGWTLRLLRFVANVLSTVSGRWASELVVTAAAMPVPVRVENRAATR